jgi:hypothetical protein
MITKAKNKKPSGPLSQKEFRAAMRRIDADLKEIKVLQQKGKELDRKIAPLLRELRKIADE